MKFTSAFSLLAYAIKVGTTQAEEGNCGKCLPLPPGSNSYQILRLWNITDPNWTAEQAMESAAKTAAVNLAKMPGFQRYTGAATGDSQLVLFMSWFDTAEQAQAAQQAAIDTPPEDNDNYDRLELFMAVETEGYAAFPQDGCITESSVGKTLTTNLYKYQDPASVDPTTLFPLDQDYYNVMYKNAPGFVMTYSSTNAPAGSNRNNWRIFESEADEAAYQAMEAESNYAWTGPADDLVISTSGTIGVDVLCSSHHLTDATTAADVSPPPPANTATAKASKTSSAKSSKTADAKAEKTSSAKAAKAGSAKATKEPKAKKTSSPKTAKATKVFRTSSKATKASPAPSAKADKAADAKADKASSAKASKAKSNSKGGKAGSTSV